MVLLKYTDIQSMLMLHEKYQAKKKLLTDQAFVENGAKTDFQIKLEEKYAEFDVKVSDFEMQISMMSNANNINRQLKGSFMNELK